MFGKNTPMNPPERKEVRIFNAVLDIATPAERAAYLDQACAGDALLRRKVEAFLLACGEADEFFKTVIAPAPQVEPPRGATL